MTFLNNTFGFGLLVLILLSASSHASNKKRSPSSTYVCQTWFLDWAEATKKNLQSEKVLADKLEIDQRMISEMYRLVDSVLMSSQSLCNRLDEIGIEAITTHELSIKNCVDTFSKMEDEMDQRFSSALFKKNLVKQAGIYAPAQDIARREARIGARLCKMLDLAKP